MKEYKKVEPTGLVEDLNPTQEAIAEVCNDLKEFLILKNKAYGNSALSPLRILSRSDTEEQLNVRIDDKLSRLMRGTSYDGDNDIDDLIGYLILKKVYRKLNG
jgi:hypothetical protein